MVRVATVLDMYHIKLHAKLIISSGGCFISSERNIILVYDLSSRNSDLCLDNMAGLHVKY